MLNLYKRSVSPWDNRTRSTSSCDLALPHFAPMAIDLGYLLLYNTAAIFTAASAALDDPSRWAVSGKAYLKEDAQRRRSVI